MTTFAKRQRMKRQVGEPYVAPTPHFTPVPLFASEPWASRAIVAAIVIALVALVLILGGE